MTSAGDQNVRQLRGEAQEVSNQPPVLEDYNAFTSDRVLCAAVEREGAAWAAADLTRFGARTGSAEVQALGRQANAWPPVLRAYDGQGRRLDVVEYHPAYHRLMEMSFAQGLHSSPWEASVRGHTARAGSVVARQAGSYMMTQVDSGHGCPVTMTNAAAPAILTDPELAAEWLPRMVNRRYDGRFAPAAEKTSVSIGMGMTEKQGGTDVRANTTRAEPIGDGLFRLTGHKWFFSAPMCDAFLVLAQAPGGLSCFFLPRWTPEGAPNALRLIRLKDKVGNRSNASAEVEFEGARAQLLGEQGRGVPAIMEMVTQTRLDCAVGTLGLMRLAVAQAAHHCAHRTVFQKRLADHPMMTRVLADLALEWESAVLLAFRMARAFDEAAAGDDAARAWQRLMTPVTKFWVCKRGPALAYEAMECLGGNGYVEEAILGRIYREMPLNAIWEGSGNVMCLDVLRVLARDPGCMDVVLSECADAARSEPRLDRALARLKDMLASASLETQGRRVVEQLARVAAASLMVRHGAPAAADAFCATRLDGDWGQMFGCLPPEADAKAIADAAVPAA